VPGTVWCAHVRVFLPSGPGDGCESPIPTPAKPPRGSSEHDEAVVLTTTRTAFRMGAAAPAKSDPATPARRAERSGGLRQPRSRLKLTRPQSDQSPTADR
jgi:hypothetical protein